MGKKPASSFQEVIRNVFEGLSRGREGQEATLFEEWPRWIGKKASLHTKPVRIRDGQLLVYVDHPTWVYELRQQKRDALMKKIDRELGKGVVEKIDFKLGNI
jgi:predicted nucleic acid-binding Zn ribbon protein